MVLINKTTLATMCGCSVNTLRSEIAKGLCEDGDIHLGHVRHYSDGAAARVVAYFAGRPRYLRTKKKEER